MQTDKSFADLWRWRRTSVPHPWPAQRDNAVYPPPPRSVSDHMVAVTFIGQASFLLTTSHGTLLTDPVFSDRVSPLSFVGPKRVRPPGLALDALPPLDAVLLSHNHYDHMDVPSLRRLREANPTMPIVTGLGNAAYLKGKGIDGGIDCDWWEAAALRPGLRVTFVPAQHWSSRSLRDRRGTLWGGFGIDVGGHRIYFAGDSGYCPWFATLRTRWGEPDLALLPIGAYEPRWFMRSQHMNPEEAVQAHRDLDARRSIGMHFGTVQLTDEPIDEPLHALARAKAAAGLEDDAFTTLDFGETRLVPLG